MQLGLLHLLCLSKLRLGLHLLRLSKLLLGLHRLGMLPLLLLRLLLHLLRRCGRPALR